MTLKNVRIIGSGHRNTFKRRISEALFIKELKPDLNVQEEAFKLSLYNSIRSITEICEVR